MRTGCKFCQKFSGVVGGEEIPDRVLFESENFVVVPTIGSIVPGWLLVVPRSHFLSAGSLDAALLQELICLRSTAEEALRDCFGSVTCFEHGAVRECESVGCGVDHAHLHLVASKFDLVANAKAPSTSQLHWREVAGIQAATACIAEQMPYVFVESASEGAWIGTGSIIESQLMRKVIATSMDQPGCWDWKTHPFESNANETYYRLKAWKDNRVVLLPHA